MAENVLVTLRKALGYQTLKEFSADWKTLSDADKADLRSAVESGTMTY